MRWLEYVMMAFVAAVFVAGLFGPYMISLMLGAATIAILASRNPGSPTDRR